MSNPFIGAVSLFAGNFAPRGWMFCQGQLLAISQYSALFALIGTTYGGDGQVTFGLPDLRGRLPIGQGQGPGLSNYVIGQSLGSETVTLTPNQMPGHSHGVTGNSSPGVSGPAGATWAVGSGVAAYGGAASLQAMNATSISSAGGNQPHNNVMPSLALNFIIAVEGIFPSRN
jgi:microcystin-dependent protein